MLRAAVLSLGLVWCGAFALGAAAQTSAAETPAGKTTAPQAKATQTKTVPAKTVLAKTASAKATQAKDAQAKPVQAKAKTKKAAAKPTPKTLDEAHAAERVSDTVVDLAGWVIASGDNRELPFAIVDKDAAQILLFGADGKLRGLAPALIGSAVGDESAPGVGDRELKDIPAGDRTTPAGRYLAAYGPAAGGKSVLWVDYATAVSIHPLPATKASRKEKRKERLASSTAGDNRITHGCINVSSTFYSKVVRTTFTKGGVFYVLPDSTPLQTAFPGFEPPARFASSTEGANTANVSLQAR
ncbi:MAG: hypothetical protein Q8R02_18105 [Hyphomonadaceae bacterium]|nr:hypothetical protein [Hyphomonadaceae bacterium]